MTRFLAFLIQLFLSGPLLAAAEQAKSEKSWERELIDDNIAISEFFDGLAEGLDLFLAGKRLTNRPNETSVKVENSTYALEGEPTTNATGVGVHLRLPNLEEYWQLKFTSYDEREEKRGVQQGYFRQSPRETNYGATVGLFRKLGDVRTTFEPRIELQDPLKISHSLSFESVADMSSFEVNPKLEFFASPTKGTGVFTALNFNFDLSKNLTFTLINEGEYRDKRHLFLGTNGFSIGHIVNARSSLSYDFILSSNNRDNYHLETYTLGMSWSRLVYRRVLDFRLTPLLNFERSLSFRGRPGMSFTLSLNF